MTRDSAVKGPANVDHAAALRARAADRMSPCCRDIARQLLTRYIVRYIVATYRSAVSRRSIDEGGKYETRLGVARIRAGVRGIRLRSRWAPPPVVRRRRHEVRDSQAAQGQAAPRLRGDERAGGADARVLLGFARHRVPHAAMARG